MGRAIVSIGVRVLSVVLTGGAIAMTIAAGATGAGCSSSSSGGTSGTSGTSGAGTSGAPGDGGSSGGSEGGAGDGGSAVDAADAAPAGPVNGCKTFDDRTGATASRTIAWMFPLAAADRCIAIKAGQSVTWNGDFTMYRVGASGGDSPNPISGFDPMSPTVAFPKAGTFGFESPDAPALVGAIKVE